MLKGGHPDSLGRTEDVVAMVLADRARLEELFATMANPDEVVRLRVGTPWRRSAASNPAGSCRTSSAFSATSGGSSSRPFSGTWPRCSSTYAIASPRTRPGGYRLLQQNLASSTDWIVLNVTMDVLTDWANHDPWLPAGSRRSSSVSARTTGSPSPCVPPSALPSLRSDDPGLGRQATGCREGCAASRAPDGVFCSLDG